MSGHADTSRYDSENMAHDLRVDGLNAEADVIDALLAENQQAHTELTQAHANIDQLLAELKRQEGLLVENQRLRDAGEGMRDALLRGSPGWLETPAGRKLLEALAGDGE